jgi:hypothetical protein
MASRCFIPLACVGALALLGCRREASDEPAPGPGPRPSAAARSAPDVRALREAMGVPSGVVSELDAPKVTPVASKVLKTRGAPGEWLESDLYFFKVDSVRPCGSSAAGDKLGRTLIGAEIQIKAKLNLTFSPREVRLSSGGIVFNTRVDFDRELEACAPLLKVAWLKKDDVITGFVLFEMPPPEPKNLIVSYQPTRWGGAGFVSVTLPGCVTCTTDRSPASSR